jgi:hypothetical protein
MLWHYWCIWAWQHEPYSLPVHLVPVGSAGPAVFLLLLPEEEEEWHVLSPP